MNREEAFEHGVKEFCKQAQYSEDSATAMVALVKEGRGLPTDPKELAAIGGIGGAVGGGILGTGAGGLAHYLFAAEEKQKLKEYIKSMLLGGAVGTVGGGLAGGFGLPELAKKLSS